LVGPRGLLIQNVTKADNGAYTCRAEVEADGRYDERNIDLVVHSKYNDSNPKSFGKSASLSHNYAT